MRYILTQAELDELKNKPRVNAQEFLRKLSEHITFKTVCLDVTMDPVSVMTYEVFASAVKKTIEYYANTTQVPPLVNN